MWVQSLDWGDPLEEGMATHSRVLAWRILCTEEPGGYSPWGRKESDTTEVTGMHARCIVRLRKKSDNVIFIVNPH